MCAATKGRTHESRAQQTKQGASGRRTHLHEKEGQKGSSNSKKKRVHVKQARGLTTVEIIRANSDPYASAKLRTQKS